jgi:hypothetical protein
VLHCSAWTVESAPLFPAQNEWAGSSPVPKKFSNFFFQECVILPRIFILNFA